METRTIIFGLSPSFQYIHEYDFEFKYFWRSWKFNGLKMTQFAYALQGNVLYLTGGMDGGAPTKYVSALSFKIDE